MDTLEAVPVVDKVSESGRCHIAVEDVRGHEVQDLYTRWAGHPGEKVVVSQRIGDLRRGFVAIEITHVGDPNQNRVEQSEVPEGCRRPVGRWP